MDRSGAGPDGRAVDRLALDGVPGVVGRCREFVQASLAARGWLDDPGADRCAVVEDVLLMTSELVTNACLYAGGPLELAVYGVGGGAVHVEVADPSPRLPAVRPLSAPAQPGGHGLRVVQQLALRWGSEARSGGKAVWFEAGWAEGVT